MSAPVKQEAKVEAPGALAQHNDSAKAHSEVNLADKNKKKKTKGKKKKHHKKHKKTKKVEATKKPLLTEDEGKKSYAKYLAEINEQEEEDQRLEDLKN